VEPRPKLIHEDNFIIVITKIFSDGVATNFFLKRSETFNSTLQNIIHRMKVEELLSESIKMSQSARYASEVSGRFGYSGYSGTEENVLHFTYTFTPIKPIEYITITLSMPPEMMREV
jgi:hypothetical protein